MSHVHANDPRSCADNDLANVSLPTGIDVICDDEITAMVFGWVLFDGAKRINCMG